MVKIYVYNSRKKKVSSYYIQSKMIGGKMNKLNNIKLKEIENPQMYNVGIYVRTIKSDMGEELIKVQKERVEEFCEFLKLKVLKVYVDIDEPKKENREKYNELIQDIKDGRINMIATANLTRIAKSSLTMTELFKLQKEYDFRIIISDKEEELTYLKLEKEKVEEESIEEEFEM